MMALDTLYKHNQDNFIFNENSSASFSRFVFVTDLGITNVETALVFSPKSFLPRTASANLTVYFHGRANSLLEVSLTDY